MKDYFVSRAATHSRIQHNNEIKSRRSCHRYLGCALMSWCSPLHWRSRKRKGNHNSFTGEAVNRYMNSTRCRRRIILEKIRRRQLIMWSLDSQRTQKCSWNLPLKRILKVTKKSGNRERCRKLSLWNRMQAMNHRSLMNDFIKNQLGHHPLITSL